MFRSEFVPLIPRSIKVIAPRVSNPARSRSFGQPRFYPECLTGEVKKPTDEEERFVPGAGKVELARKVAISGARTRKARGVLEGFVKSGPPASAPLIGLDVTYGRGGSRPPCSRARFVLARGSRADFSGTATLFGENRRIGTYLFTEISREREAMRKEHEVPC